MNKNNKIYFILVLALLVLLPMKVFAFSNGKFRIFCREYDLNPDQETECHFVAEVPEDNSAALVHIEIADQEKITGGGTNGLNFKKDKIGTIFENTKAYHTEKGAAFHSEIEAILKPLGTNVEIKCPDNVTVSEEGCYEYLYNDLKVPNTPKVPEKPGFPNGVRENIDFTNTVSLGYVTVSIAEDALGDSDCAHLCVNAYVYEKDGYGNYVRNEIGGDCVELNIKEQKVCVIEIQDDEKVYYGKDGDEVSEEQYRKDCPVCRIDNDKYYDHNGEEVTKEEWAASCLCRIQNGIFYDNTGAEVSEEQYKKACGCRIDTVNGKWYDNNANEVTEEEYKKACVPETGSFASYAVLAAGALIALSAITIAKKHNRFYRV